MQDAHLTLAASSGTPASSEACPLLRTVPKITNCHQPCIRIPGTLSLVSSLNCSSTSTFEYRYLLFSWITGAKASKCKLYRVGNIDRSATVVQGFSRCGFFLTARRGAVRCGAVLPNRTAPHDFAFLNKTAPHRTAPCDSSMFYVVCIVKTK